MPGLYARFEAGTLSAEQMARFTVLLLINYAFYTNKKEAVNLNILRSLEYLERLSDYDWAGFMLAVLYRDMSDLGLKRIKPRGIYYFWEVSKLFSSLTAFFSLTGRLTLSFFFQVWAYEHFPAIAPFLQDADAVVTPVAHRL